MKSVVAEISASLSRDDKAVQISGLWDRHQSNRRGWLAEKLELRNYIFATDTTKTSNASLPWKNKTTIPKLCQIRDNLHANYMSALFPNDTWLRWEGFSQSAVIASKRKAIESYMQNKTREGDFRVEVAKLLYDYIDYGNAFYDVVWTKETTTDPETGAEIAGYIGPRLCRLSPLDVVFDPLASNFDSTYKITRYVKTIGELMLEVDTKPELRYNKAIVVKASEARKGLSAYTVDDINKSVGFQVDGFGTIGDYYRSNYVEILEFEGSMHDDTTGEFLKNVIITVVDRSYVIRQEQMPSWLGKSTKGHVGWRYRPDNVYSMGPLDNLVGMQYRIDHLENLKADAMDLAVHPPLAISGNVEEFEWGPKAEIYIGEGGAIKELGMNLQGVIAANNEIATLEIKMEEMAGAPKQAMGIRTPGEKTAFEVQSLEMAASRIFQNKIQNFEISLLEPALNRMLELARRNMDGADIIRTMDDDIGVQEFLSITKEDITATGKLRPIGARHFAQQATVVQNMMGLVNSALWTDPGVRGHFSGKAIAHLAEELLGLERFALVRDNAQVFESFDTQQLVQTAGEELQVQQATPIEPEQAPVNDQRTMV